MPISPYYRAFIRILRGHIIPNLNDEKYAPRSLARENTTFKAHRNNSAYHWLTTLKLPDASRPSLFTGFLKILPTVCAFSRSFTES